jgi:hypothetical protein
MILRSTWSIFKKRTSDITNQGADHNCNIQGSTGSISSSQLYSRYCMNPYSQQQHRYWTLFNMAEIWTSYIMKQWCTLTSNKPGSTLTLSWPAGHICPIYNESFLVRWDNSIPLFLHAAIYLEVSLFRWTSQNAFFSETAVSRENAFWLVYRNRYTSR